MALAMPVPGRTVDRSVGAGIETADGADATVFLIALGQQLIDGEIGELKELVGQGLGHPVRDGSRLQVGASKGLGNHFINDLEVDEILRAPRRPLVADQSVAAE